MIARFELVRLVRSRRPWLAASCVLFFLALMLAGFILYARNETGGEARFRYTFENRSYFNGLTFALYAFYFGFLLILPVFGALEGAAQIASDTASGRMALLLTRPIGRTRLFATKALVAAGYLALLTGFLLAASLAIGLLLVGWGDLDLYPGVLQMTDRHQHLEQDVALVRFLLAWPAASLALATPLALGLWLSSFGKSPLNAAGLTVSVYLVLYVVAEIHFFRDLRPWLFTSAMPYWRALFRPEPDWPELGREAAKLAGFSALFAGLALRRFRLREEC